MKPMQIKGMGYSPKSNRSFYFIVKKSNLVKPINNVMEKIGFDLYFCDGHEIEISANHMDHYKNKNYDIDLISTENRLIIIVRADEVHQKKFKELMLAYGIFQV